MEGVAGYMDKDKNTLFLFHTSHQNSNTVH